MFQPYFCGNKDECREHGSLWALEQAIKNVDKFYPVVGLLENLNGTLALAEKKLPLFFAGAYEAYNSQWKGGMTKREPCVFTSAVKSNVFSRRLQEEQDEGVQEDLPRGQGGLGKQSQV